MGLIPVMLRADPLNLEDSLARTWENKKVSLACT